MPVVHDPIPNLNPNLKLNSDLFAIKAGILECLEEGEKCREFLVVPGEWPGCM